MAHKKAKIDPHQKKCEDEAREHIKNWFENQSHAIDKKHLHVVWFAYIHNGFKCMITSIDHDNLFFEITVNKITNEVCCNCFKRFEYFVQPTPSSLLSSSFNPLPLRVIESTNNSLV